MSTASYAHCLTPALVFQHVQVQSMVLHVTLQWLQQNVGMASHLASSSMQSCQKWSRTCLTWKQVLAPIKQGSLTVQQILLNHLPVARLIQLPYSSAFTTLLSSLGSECGPWSPTCPHVAGTQRRSATALQTTQAHLEAVQSYWRGHNLFHSVTWYLKIALCIWAH